MDGLREKTRETHKVAGREEILSTSFYSLAETPKRGTYPITHQANPSTLEDLVKGE